MSLSKRLAAHPDLLASAVLAAFNAWIAARLFTTEYFDHFDSIEGAFIGISRFISRHWGNFSWWPLWHCGMPYQDTYVPLLHVTVAAIATVGHISAAHAYHIAGGIAYSFGPVTLYLLAAYLGASRGAAFVSAVIYSLFSPCTLLMPLVARDTGSIQFSRRLQVLAVYGEGPHIAVMTLLPLAILALAYALRKRTARALATAAIALALIFLTNVPGTMATALAVLCWLAAQPAGRWRAAWMVAGSAALLAYAIACYGIPPSAELTVLGNIGAMHKGFSAGARLAPFLLLLLLAAIFGAGRLLARTRLPFAVRWALLYFALLAPMVLTADTKRFEMLPQVARLQLEMEMAICLLVGPILWYPYSRSGRKVRQVLALLFLAAVCYQAVYYRRSARHFLQPADPATRSEFASARWAETNLPGQRIYVTGSASFWWNAFSDSPQVIGCCDQGESLAVLNAMPYLINFPAGPYHELLTKAYLEALGAQAIVVSGPQSTDEYKDIREPGRFDAMLAPLHRELGDTIYAVPQRNHSLAHAIRPPEIVPPSPTVYQVYAYSQVIEDPTRPSADFAWLGDTSARVRTDLALTDLVAVQVPWFRGWKAFVRGHRIPISADGLGFQVLHPNCSGPCEITMQWTGRPDGIPSMLISLAGILLTVFLLRGE